MPFNEEKMKQPITRLEMAAMLLPVLAALQSTRWALAALKRGGDPSSEIENVAKEAEELTKKWEEFTGWSPSNGD